MFGGTDEKGRKVSSALLVTMLVGASLLALAPTGVTASPHQSVATISTPSAASVSVGRGETLLLGGSLVLTGHCADRVDGWKWSATGPGALPGLPATPFTSPGVNPSTVPVPTTAYVIPATAVIGTYVVELQADNLQGNSCENQVPDTFSLQVVNGRPTAVLGASSLTVEAGSGVTLSGVGSSDADAAVLPGIVNYEFTLDGVAQTPQTSATFAWTPLPVVGDHTASLRVMDADGAWSTNLASVTISLIDTTPPSISGVVTDIPVEATGALTPISYTAPSSATDNAFPGIVSVLCAPAVGTPMAVGAHAVTCTATDGSGNAANAFGTATVLDTTAPTITAVADFPVEATSAAGAFVSITPPLATDLVDGSVASTCDLASGTYALGPHTVSCDHTDTAGNAAPTESFTFTVQDTTGPAIAQPDDIVTEATGPTGASVIITLPGTTDAVDGAGVASCDATSGVFAVGSVLVECTAVDTAGNAAAPVYFTVTVQDETAPIIQQGIPAFVAETAACGLVEGFPCAYVGYITPLSIDLVDGSEAATCLPASGSAFPVGSTLVRCDDTDTAGNVATPVFFAITVLGNDEPVIAQIPDLTFEATSAAGANIAYALPIVGDIEDGNGVIVPVCDPASGTLVALDTPTTVTCDAEDSSGFTDSMSFAVTVVDTTAPALDDADDITVVATSADGAAVSFTVPGWTDAVDGTGDAECDAESGDTFPIGSTLVTCTVTDLHGNDATERFLVNVVTSAASIEAVTPAFTGVLTTSLQWLEARVLDQADNPVSGVLVSWAIVSGGGSISVPTSVTDADGIARAQLTPGEDPALNVVEASVDGLVGSPVTFTVQTVSPGGIVDDGVVVSDDPWIVDVDLGPRTGGQRVLVFLPEGGLIFALLFDFDPAWTGGDVTLRVAEREGAPFVLGNGHSPLGYYDILVSVDGSLLGSTEGVLSGAAVGWAVPGDMFEDFLDFRTYRVVGAGPVEDHDIAIMDLSGPSALMVSFVPGFSTFALGGTPAPDDDGPVPAGFFASGGADTFLPKAHEPFSAFACVDSEICRLETLTVRFRATSSDVDGEGLQYRWNFGDGGSSNDPAPTHTFPARGKYTVTLETTDGLLATRAFREVVAAPPLDLGLPAEVVLTVGENTVEVQPDPAIQTLRVLLAGRQLGPVFNRPFALSFDASEALVAGIGPGAVLTIEGTDDLGIPYTGTVPVSAILERGTVQDPPPELAEPPADTPGVGLVVGLAALGAVALVARKRKA